MKTGSILIVDDNISVLKSLNFILKHEFEFIETISNPELIRSKLTTHDFDVVILDMNYISKENTGNEGVFWTNEILKINKDFKIILITAFGNIDLAVKAIKTGAYDFITKPWDNDQLISTIQNAIKLKKSERKNEKLKEEKRLLVGDVNRNFDPIIGESETIKNLRKQIDKIAPTDANVLILGENGTGKELIAREIHHKSLRKDNVFVQVDLGSLTESLFESELFGHVKGAFTDAKENYSGKFQIAHEGSIFLDEIGNIPIHLQAKLLTVLQNRSVQAIGSNKQIPIDVRVISATNSSLKKKIEEGHFREDLFYRLNTIVIEAPPLRERDMDIEIIATYFLNKYADNYNKNGLQFSDEAVHLMYEHTWPGNIRELKHAIERAVILCETSAIQPEDFTFKLNDSKYILQKPMALEEIEKIAIESALRRNNWNIQAAAKELNIIRQTLYRKIEKYGLK